MSRRAIDAGCHAAYNLQLDHISKRYHGRTVLDQVSLQVGAGELVAVLGANGAGKTTLISTALGLVAADSGQVRLFAQLQQGTARPAALKQRLGVMLQIGAVNANLTVAEQCDLFCSYYQGGPHHQVTELLQLAGLQAQTNSRFSQLSGGQKQRLLFALALAGKPDLLFLDEPTLGMDAAARRGLWQNIRQLKQSGTSIVLTTHYLEEAEQLADRILVLHQGRIIANGTPAQLKANLGGKVISCQTQLTDSQLQALPGVTRISRSALAVQLQSQQAEQTLRALLQSDSSVSELEVHAVALEQAFLQLIAQEHAA